MRARRLLLNVGVAAVLLLAAEGWCSLHDKLPKYRLSPTLGFELVPGYRSRRETVNLAGLRGDEVGPKRPGSVRILAMGGSTTWGHMVADGETWPVALQRELRAATGVDVEVLNGGVSGWDLEHIVVALRQGELDALQPDLVLVNAGWNIPLIAGNASVAGIRHDVIAATRRDGLYRSALVRRLARALAEWQQGDETGPQLDDTTATAELRARCYPVLFTELRRLCDERAIPVLALAYPSLVQRPPPPDPEALAAYEAALRARFGDRPDLQTMVAIARNQYEGGLQAVVAGSAQAGIGLVDLASRLAAELPPEDADAVWAGYFRDQAHFTPAGDAAVGRALAGLLVDAHVVGARP
jgi:lysophospholipase L1-like esterase